MHHLAEDIGQTVLNIGTVVFAVFVAYKLNRRRLRRSGTGLALSGDHPIGRNMKELLPAPTEDSKAGFLLF